MNNIKIEVEEKISYWQRMRNPLLELSFPIALCLIASIISHTFGILIAGVIGYFIPCILNYSYVVSYTQNFVTLFQIQDGVVIIEYTQKRKKGRIKRKLEDCKFVRKFPSRGSLAITLYPDEILKVESKNETLLIQGKKWGWEGPFDELTSFLDQNGLLEKSKYYRWLSRIFRKDV